VSAPFKTRAKSIATKPMFRDMFKKFRRVNPASGFCEGTGRESAKQPDWFTVAAGVSSGGAIEFILLVKFCATDLIGGRA
jgi:putative SOS response-associated peptidase YedK